MPISFTYQPPAVNAGAVVHGLVQAAEIAGGQVLLAASQPLVPVELGELKASGKVEHGPDGAEVSYSAVSEDGYDYAAIQHEREDYNHPNGGQAHYLADPMTTARNAILAAMAAEVRL